MTCVPGPVGAGTTDKPSCLAVTEIQFQYIDILEQENSPNMTTIWRPVRATNVREILYLISTATLTDTRIKRDSLVKAGAFTNSTQRIAIKRKAVWVARVVRTLRPS